MIPKEETPLERIERDIDWLKSLRDITYSVVRPVGILHLGPWESLDEQTKDELLGRLDWSGVSDADWRRIRAREVKDYELFQPKSPYWIEETRLP